MFVCVYRVPCQFSSVCTRKQTPDRPCLVSVVAFIINHISFTLNRDPLKREERITPKSRQGCIIRFKIRQPVFMFVLDFLNSFIQENFTPFT